MLDSMRGALIGSGVGIPLAFAGDLAAGTLGSALEQYIGTGSLDVRESVTRGLNNAISNAFYGTAPLGSIGEAFGWGFGAGMANGGVNYLSEVLGGLGAGGASGSPRGSLQGIPGGRPLSYKGPRNPLGSCGGEDPFAPVLGYGASRGYRYEEPGAGRDGRGNGFRLKDFLTESLVEGINGGLASAAFFGLGQGIEKLQEGIRGLGRADGGDGSPLRTYYQVTSKESAQALVKAEKPKLKGRESNLIYVWTEQPTYEQASNSGARFLETVIKFDTSASFSVQDYSIQDSALHEITRVSDRPGPLTISNVTEVGFKNSKRWWEFWKK